MQRCAMGEQQQCDLITSYNLCSAKWRWRCLS
jgi:hypothetical protein